MNKFIKFRLEIFASGKAENVGIAKATARLFNEGRDKKVKPKM
jgi:DNA-binding Xre family transcriptional regulator